MSGQSDGGAPTKRPFTTNVPRSSQGRALYVVGLTLLGIGGLCAAVGGWTLAMWAFEDHGAVDTALIVGICGIAGSLVTFAASGFAFAWAARGDRRDANVEEPPRMHVWAAVRTALHQRTLP